MSDDLVKRLRANALDECDEAIERIKGLECAVRYEADLAQQALDAREELEAKLVKAVEALSDLADCVDLGCFCSEMEQATVMDKARATLAELKENKNE